MSEKKPLVSNDKEDDLVRSYEKPTCNSNVVTGLSIVVALVSLGIAIFFILYPMNQGGEKPVTVFTSKGGGDRPAGAKWSTRSPVIAKNVAATSHPLATQTAIDVLKAGGNAIDAAIAANAVLGLVEPTGSGIGGDLMAIVWDPVNKTLHGLNAGGRSSFNVSYDKMKELIKGNSYLPDFGELAVNVPGCVDGWFELHNKWGTKNMSYLLSHAIQYATYGFPLTQIISSSWRGNVNAVVRYNATNPIPYLKNFMDTYTRNGIPPVEGQMWTNQDLARTLTTIADHGRDAFYNGTLTTTMVDFFSKIGCCLTRKDFELHNSTWETPISSSYRNYTLHELFPNTQGLAALQILNILENFNLTAMGHNSADFLHVSVEAKKLAFADRAKYYADPLFYNEKTIVPALNNKTYALERSKLIDMKRAMKTVDAGNPKLYQGDTIYMTVADQSGLMVSLIQSNYQGLGSALVPDGLGFCFQDRGQLFSMDPGSANVYAPGKRPFHTIIPAFVTKDEKPYMSFGVMGGAMQPQGHAQIMVNMVDFGMDVQAAGDTARWYHFMDNEPTGEIMVDGGKLGLESGITENVQAELISRGHTLASATGSYGGYQAIMWDENNQVYRAASEMRKDGHAAGF
jgi:gamma-glutamyltranspeptidase/glutathione hydrolase